MDVQKKQCLKKRKVKSFTISAVAAIVLTFNAEIARAISCPSMITGSIPGICNFDAGSSVTVTSSGSVDSIIMSNYHPAGSFITIDAGGAVNDTLSVAAIFLSNSSLSDGILNNGTISNAIGACITIGTSSVVSGGIRNSGTIRGTSTTGITILDSSTVNGGISNTGTISTGSIGMSILNFSTINGDILNSGTISSAGGTGIRIVNSSTINGGISNNGTIQTGGVFVGITISDASVISDGIVNTGLIEAAASGNGILIRNGSTISGGISNSGIITSAGQSGISIFNTSNIQGNISNSGRISGDLQGLSIHNGSFLNGNIVNSGTIRGDQHKGISIFSSTTINGGISNSGTIRGGETGIAITSSCTITGGISNSGTIQGDINAIHISSDSIVDGLNIFGQSARIIGSVVALNTDVNITSGAVFTSEGTYNVRTFNIDSNALFNMANAITANAVNNSGTLSTTSSQTIAGDYAQLAGGVFQTSISGISNYGSLAVTGAVDLSQSGNINVQINPNTSLHAGDVLANVISGNTLITPENGFTVTDNSFFWMFDAAITNNTEVNLTTAVNPAVYTTCQGDYCQGAATVIINQIAAGNSLFNPYAALTTSNAFATAASKATPELTNENVQVTQLVTRSVMDTIPMWSMLHKSTGTAGYEEGNVWIKPYGGSMTQNQSNSVDGFNATAYGVVIGKDTQLTEDDLFGGAFAVGADTINGKSALNGQSINSDTVQGMLYGAKRFPHHLYLAGQGLIGYGDNSTQRDIPLYASTAEGSYSSWFTDLRTQLGWNYVVNPSLIFTPEFDASYLFVKQGSYQETGSPMDLSVNSSNNSSLVLGVYGNGALHLTTLRNKQDITLTAYAGAARNVLNSQPETTATFVAGGPSFSTFGVQFDETVFRGGAGLTMFNPTKPFKVNVNYDMQKGNSAYSGVGSVTIAYLI